MRDKKIKLHWRFLICYKKNTLAIFFSFVLTFMLATTMLVLIHTNHRIENIQAKTLFTPSDCSISGISKKQVLKLKKDSSIDILAVEQIPQDYTRNGQIFRFLRADNVAITMMSTVIEGRLPKEKNEIAAEKWVLLNLGIEPLINQEFTIQNYDREELETVKLVGILSDIPRNKQYGVRILYAPIDEDLKIKDVESKKGYAAYLRFKDNVDYNKKVKSLISELGVKKKQIRKCPARENFKELYRIDVQVISLILLICMIVFYGIYRIALAVRQKQYGILRAIGMKKRQLQDMILLELYQIYAISIPIGLGAGLLLAFFIVKISGDGESAVYLYNQSVPFSPVIPVKQIIFCAGFIAVFIGIVGILAGRKIIQRPIVESISDSISNGKNRFSIIKIKKKKGKLSTLFFMGFQYIFQDVKTSAFLVLTICTGMALFTGLSYRAELLKTYREDTKETWYLNGQYEMSMLGFDRADEGVSRQSVEKMEKLIDISGIKTASGVRIRVLDEGKKRNDIYYNELNKNHKKYYGYEFAGNDGKNQVYKSILYGYNTAALKELKKYIVAGDFDPDNIKEDEIILSVLSTDDARPEELPSNYREGTPLMKYQVGEEIQIKYRADFNTNGMDYETFTDSDNEYIYRTYKIAAIVSFGYMFDCNRTVYPLLITSDQAVRDIMPDSHIQCIYIDGNETMTIKEQIELERQLILIGAENENVATRSLIAEIKQNEMFYRKQMVYIYGIAIAAFVLVLINMINNIKYRMQIRTREICMLRAIGMSIAMIKRMLLFENGILGIISIAAAYFLSWPALKYLYKLSDMKLYGHQFHYNYSAFLVISLTAMLILVILSTQVLESWKTKQIIEAMGKIE